MANPKQFYRSLDLQKNELQNAILHKLASAPSSPEAGQFYYNTTDNKLYIYNGASFEASVGDITSIADNGDGTINVTSGSSGDVTIGVNIANIIDDSSSTSSNLWSANKIISYTQTATEGLNVKLAVAAATTSALPSCTYNNGSSGVGATLTGDANGALAAIDGITLSANDRVLIQDQVDATENGIYTVTTIGDASNAFVLTRASDFDTTEEIKANSFCFVEAGNTYSDIGLVLASGDSPTLGTTDLVFTQFTGAGAFTAGDGISQSGNTINVNVDNSTIEVNLDTLRLKDAGITTAKVADNAITTAKILDANVTTAKIADSNVTTAKIANSAITAAKLANKYAAAFASGDFSSGDLTISAATHGVGATEDLVVTVKDANGEDVTSGVEISADSSGNVTISVNTGLEFSGRVIIRN